MANEVQQWTLIIQLTGLTMFPTMLKQLEGQNLFKTLLIKYQLGGNNLQGWGKVLQIRVWALTSRIWCYFSQSQERP